MKMTIKKAVTPTTSRATSRCWCEGDLTLKKLNYIRKDAGFQKIINKWMPTERGQKLIDAADAAYKETLKAIKADDRNGSIQEVSQFDSNRVYAHVGYEKSITYK